MTGLIETDIPGEPAAFTALADHLRAVLAVRVEDLADRTAAERSSLSLSWEGAAADAFGERAATLVAAGDGVAGQARAAAAEVQALGEVLAHAQHGMAQVRTSAAAGGLVVEGTVIMWPPDAWQLDLLETTRLQEVWNDALAGAEAQRRIWYASVDRAAAFAERQSSTLLSLTAELMMTAAERGLLFKTSRVLAAEAEFRAKEAQRCRSRIPEVADSIERFNDPADRALLERLVREEIDNRRAAETLAKTAAHPELPVELRGGLGLFDTALAGYGVYADIQEGESTEQAVVSQGAGLVAGTLAAAGAGAAAGSWFPGPGTLGGAILGGGTVLVAGAAASFAGDKAVDHFAYGHADSDAAAEEPEPDPGDELLEYAAEALSSPHSADQE